MKSPINLFILVLFIAASCYQPEAKQPPANEETEPEVNQVFTNKNVHEVPDRELKTETGIKQAKNIILLIGDGMGTSQVYAGAIANRGKLNLLTMPINGNAITHASDNDITDSAAGATAFSAGIKTYNGAIGVDPDTTSVKTILEMAEEAGMSTGLVATCRITHATPASFIAHQPSRSLYEDIAADFLKTDIDVFIGGGLGNFNSRQDGLDLTEQLATAGYQVITNVEDLSSVRSGKLAGLIHEGDQEPVGEGRGKMLETATSTALEILSSNDQGFFLMIEGSQIDWGGHANRTEYLVQEMLDFDKAVGLVLDFAKQNPETLVVVTADHETGGFSIVNADIKNGVIEGSFTTGGHTSVMVPVYAYGPKAHQFTGTYQNTEIFFKMKAAYGWD